MRTLGIPSMFQEIVGKTPEEENVPFLVLPWHSVLIL
jgi:hypothetical protein